MIAAVRCGPAEVGGVDDAGQDPGMRQFPAAGRGLLLALGRERGIEPALPAPLVVPGRGPVAENEHALHAGEGTETTGSGADVESTSGHGTTAGLGRFDPLESRNQT